MGVLSSQNSRDDIKSINCDMPAIIISHYISNIILWTLKLDFIPKVLRDFGASKNGVIKDRETLFVIT